MCLDNYIGIRGECSNAKVYLDDLPGINIENVSDITDSSFIRPKQLVQSCFNLALDQVFNDFINIISDVFDYKEIISDAEYENVGTDEFYGLVNENVTITICKNSLYHKFSNISIYSFGIVSDRVATVTFSCKDKYGKELKSVDVELEEGFNEIDLSLTTNSKEITITFNLSDFKAGKDKLYHTECLPCELSGCYDCLTVKSSNYKVGFLLKVKCIANRCEIINFFLENLKTPLLYKTGINYLIEAKMTTRVNAYTRNSDDKINDLLLLWQGGVDVTTGIKTNSTYWQAMKVAANSTINTLKGLRTKVFEYNSNEIINMLP